jgi:SARP family transcriptional regulator, regulator of embCAB operon
MRSLIDSAAELIRRRQFARAGSVLREVITSGRANGPVLETVEALCPLCEAAAEQRRLAEALATAASRHRAAEDRLHTLIEGVLADCDTREPSGSADGPPRRRAVESRCTIEVFILGPLHLAIGGRPVSRWRSSKARSLFEYLSFHPDRPIRRDVLMDVFWPGYTRESARNNLNVAFYNLRRTLQDLQDESYVLYADACYLLNPELLWWIDRDEFAALIERARDCVHADRFSEAVDTYQRAIALYRGPLFEDDSTSEWHLYERRNLEDVYIQALEQLAELRLRFDDPARAEDAARRALGSDPCRESVHRLLMRCYADQHQHDLVSRQLQICITSLRDELGIAPAPETVDLCDVLTRRA